MLATLGEAPLNSLTDPHTFKGACLERLATRTSTLQADGWWFNREQLTIAPNIGDSKLYLPGDVVNVMVEGKPNLVQRGRYLYDTVAGTNLFDYSVTATVIRLLPFEELPEIVAEYIAAYVTLSFQTDFDGDGNKQRRLENIFADSRIAFNAEATRQAKYNLVLSNPRLVQIKRRAIRYR